MEWEWNHPKKVPILRLRAAVKKAAPSLLQKIRHTKNPNSMPCCNVAAAAGVDSRTGSGCAGRAHACGCGSATCALTKLGGNLPPRKMHALLLRSDNARESQPAAAVPTHSHPTAPLLISSSTENGSGRIKENARAPRKGGVRSRAKQPAGMCTRRSPPEKGETAGAEPPSIHGMSTSECPRSKARRADGVWRRRHCRAVPVPFSSRGRVCEPAGLESTGPKCPIISLCIPTLYFSIS